MSITQYSRIQHRRGLSVDLPSPLNTSEFGHVLDERRLFIGNGDTIEGAPATGNTEIITEFTLLSKPDALKYTYKSNTSVDATTGPTPSNPIVRSVVAALDDRLSIKAYGAMGDGTTDDSAAINRALEDIYTVAIPGPSPEMGYRAIYFPAGTYILDADQIYLPPYTILIGDGPDKTIIRMVAMGAQNVVRTADSDFQIDIQIGNGGATFPTEIAAFGISFENTNDADVISLERASNILFDYCKFKSGWTAGPSTGQLINIDILSSVYAPENIHFVGCEFEGAGYVTNLGTGALNSRNIRFVDCSHKTLRNGIIVDEAISDVMVVTNNFEDIELSAIFAGGLTTRVSSNNNSFKDCGDPSNAVVVFDTGATECSSINDHFENSGGQNIEDLGERSLILNPQEDMKLHNMRFSGKKTELTLSGNVVAANTGISFDVTKEKVFFIDYSLKRDVGGNIYTRVGRLFVSTDGTPGGTGTVLGDMSTESGATGITFDANLPAMPGDTLFITYTATAGNNFSLSYQIKSWDAS